MTDLLGMPFLRNALLAGTFLGALLGGLGLWLVLRRLVFLGAALPQAAALGVAAALVAGGPPLAGGVLAALCATALLSLHPPRGRVPAEAATGLLFCAGGSGAVLLLSRSAAGETHLLEILSGDLLGTTPEDAALAGGLAALVLLLHLVFGRIFLLVSYDPVWLRAIGRSIRSWETLLFLLIGVSVALALRAVGSLVATSLLIGPATAALLLARTLRTAAPVACLLGACATPAGLAASLAWDLPAGPAVAACAILPVFLALPVAALRRG